MREATFDEADYPFKRCILRCEQQMDVFWHDDKIVQKKMAFAAIMLQRFEEQVGIRGHLKKSATVEGCGRY